MFLRAQHGILIIGQSFCFLLYFLPWLQQQTLLNFKRSVKCLFYVEFSVWLSVNSTSTLGSHWIWEDVGQLRCWQKFPMPGPITLRGRPYAQSSSPAQHGLRWHFYGLKKKKTLILLHYFIGYWLVCFDFCLFACVFLCFCFCFIFVSFWYTVDCVERWGGPGRNWGRVKHDQNIMHGKFFSLIEKGQKRMTLLLYDSIKLNQMKTYLFITY